MPWADAVYGCDKAWWQYRCGLKDFPGLKMCWAGNGLDGFPDIRRVEIAKSENPQDVYSSSILTEKVGVIGGGWNSGFQSLNLAVQFGARRILLVGYDMTDRGGLHWYGRNTWNGANNPSDHAFRRWVGAFQLAVPTLKALGVEVINTSPNSALRCFPNRSIADMLKEWS